MEKTYKEMYTEAAHAINRTDGYYKGYTEGNAMSLYVYDKYDINAADNSTAHDALCDAAHLLN